MRDKFKDFSDWLYDWVGVLILPTLLVMILGGFIAIAITIYAEDQTNKQIKQCFMEQREDTPECKYLIYKNIHSSKSSSSTVVPIIMHK